MKHENDGRAAARAGAILTIDLAAIAENYRRLSARAAPASCAAVVKADGYGLGAVPVSRALRAAGCRTFFVAHLDEAIRLRAALGPEPEILVLHGIPPGTEGDFTAAGLLPVLNSLPEIAGWQRHARSRGSRLRAAVQFDTGMARFGLSESDAGEFDRSRWEAIEPVLAMSHLGCADKPDHPANALQRDAFARMRRHLPATPASLAASSGIFLGADYAFDLVRPGAALFGVNPTPGRPNPMRPVLRLAAKVAQVRDVPAGTPVGYGWTARVAGPARLATLAVGYADGFLRSLSNAGSVWRDGVRCPVVGRVSMDSIVVDASALAADALVPGDLVDLVGPDAGVDDLAAAAGTIGYEILTGLGSRFHRRYIGGDEVLASEPGGEGATPQPLSSNPG